MCHLTKWENPGGEARCYLFAEISVVIVVFGWRELCKVDKLFWILTQRSLWGVQVETFWQHSYIKVWSTGEAMKQSKIRGPRTEI